ncbi:MULTISPECIES: NUDIX domain-containing protein [Streptosporangium]|uniref:NUDIX domain-containing protein n=1 Tax=Streptosporangium TaxID=2000 RepID=UPI0027D86234|nr:NUDIX domain-containing protein [Streptosporangium brasiliense]
MSQDPGRTASRSSLRYHLASDAPVMHLCEVPSGDHGANAVVTDDAGDILMIHSTDSHDWTAPGGAIDPGGSSPPAAIRRWTADAAADRALPVRCRRAVQRRVRPATAPPSATSPRRAPRR